jgi:hypothetical protein
LNGSNAVYTQGNVGVGTTSPSAKITALTSTTPAIYAETSTGMPIYGQSTATTGTNYAVRGVIHGTGGAAILGSALATTGSADGIRAVTSSALGVGVAATNLANGIGLHAQGGIAVEAEATTTTGTTHGVRGSINSPNGAAIYGQALTATGTASGVSGTVLSPNGAAVVGTAAGGNGNPIGVRGQSFASGGYGVLGVSLGWAVYAAGKLGASGTKSFIQPHPDDASRAVQFICLEGNESGTYFRGKTRLVNGAAEISIPAEWKLVSETEGITVQVTPRAAAVLFVPVATRERIVVQGQPDCEFHYLVNGVRRGFASYEPYLENHAFRPEIRGVPYATQYPKELRDVLVKNGTLNADYTPNEATAARLGWKLKDPEEVPLRERWWIPAEQRTQEVTR